MSDEATSRGVQLSVDAQVPQVVTSDLVRRLGPQFRCIVDAQSKETLARAIQEAATDHAARDANDDEWMSHEFREILESGARNEAGRRAGDSLKDLYGN